MKNKLSPIGLDPQKSKKLASKLNLLLANYQILYMNTRGFHWNVTGEKFFELHLKFEELYNNFNLKVDEIAERVLTLGHTPMHSYHDYLKHATIAENRSVLNGKQSVESIVSSFRELIILQREILDIANDMGDEGSNALMSDNIREQEKTVWMLNAYLG